MADAAKKPEEEEEAPPSGGGRKTLLLVVGATLVALGVGAGGTWFLVRPDPSQAAVEGGETGATETPEGVEEPETVASASFQERVFALDPFVVNVTGNEYARYLKLKIELEAESPAVVGELEGRLPQLRDAVILLLSSKRLSDITDFEGKALLKQDILERINGLLETGSVRDVLFTEFVVQ